MAEEVKMSEVVDEIKNANASANEDELTKVIERWLERTRTDGLKLGAKYVALATFGAIQKNLNKPKPSLRDYERCIKDIRKIVAVPIAKQNETTEANDVAEEVSNDKDNIQEAEV